MKPINKKSSKKPFIIIIVILLLAAIAFYMYSFAYNRPSEESDSPSKTTVPTIQEPSEIDTPTSEGDTTNIDENNTPSAPTKVPGKTPSQYENEAVDDEPAYSNEQFRIPEESL